MGPSFCPYRTIPAPRPHNPTQPFCGPRLDKVSTDTFYNYSPFLVESTQGQPLMKLNF